MLLNVKSNRDVTIGEKMGRKEPQKDHVKKRKCRALISKSKGAPTKKTKNEAIELDDSIKTRFL